MSDLAPLWEGKALIAGRLVSLRTPRRFKLEKEGKDNDRLEYAGGFL